MIVVFGQCSSYVFYKALLQRPVRGLFSKALSLLWQVSIVGIGHEFKTYDGEDVQQYIDLMDKDEIAEAPADAAMQE